jgi:uncharacterized protein
LIDLEPIAKQLKLPLQGVQRTAELLEEGNTVPFVTRFRRDQTGGLDEQQIRAIEKEVIRVKLLSERKEAILKSIESRGQLTPGLADQVKKARTLRAVEDIYLPYKPKKQSLAALARSRGLEPLALEIIAGQAESHDLAARAAAFVDPEKELADVEAVLDGARHLVAEHFGNHAALRAKVRGHLWRQGRLVSKKSQEPAESPDANSPEDSKGEDQTASPAPAGAVEPPAETASEIHVAGEPHLASTESPTSEPVQVEGAETSSDASDQSDSPAVNSPVIETPATVTPTSEVATTETPTPDTAATETPATEAETTEAETTETAATETASETPTSETETSAASPTETASVPSSYGELQSEASTPSVGATEPKAKPERKAKKDTVLSRRDQRRETRRRRRDRLVQSFKDYFDFSDPIGKVPHHRILAINRGERTKVLRVRIECADWAEFQAEIEKEFIPPEHMHAEFLRKCWQDAMTRLLLPSIEREVRRELNDKAEEHAVKVFARNLRKLLLQPPLQQHRVVAIDPGYRSGCKLIALDEFGKVLGHTFVNLVGKEQQKQTGREGLIQFVQQHRATVIVIGNGAACRETETLVASVLTTELKDQDIGYLIVNEAGTSAYSTSELGREELPDYDATVRGAVSIGRRSLDPLSELVKIDPASIGVGLYQHDVKAKHLRESLDAVVESCVNYVGVDVNSASPALLRYVSGLNALTARRIFEHRQQHGPFRRREQLKEVTGIGESTYVQAAGFLRIVHGENPLDGTWIHPESYPIAGRVLDAIGFSVEDLRVGESPELAKQTPSDAPPESTSPESTSSEATSPERTAPEPDSPEPNSLASTPEQTSSGSAVPETQSESPSPGMTTPESPPSAPVLPESTPCEVSSPESMLTEQPTVDNSAPVDAAQAIPVDAEAESTDSTQSADGSESTDSTQSADSTESTPPESSSIAHEPVSPGTDSAAIDSPVACEVASPDTSSSIEQPAPASSAHARKAKELAEKLASIEVDKLAPELGVGTLSLEYILKSLARPGRDPREDLPPPIFRREILKLEDLKSGMELAGSVLNVVDFGAFVDIGLVDSGLIHVSRLADRFVSDPHDVVSVGDILRVWVVEVDQKRRRVSLTAIEPGTERPRGQKPSGETAEQTRAPRPRKSEPRVKKKDAKSQRLVRGRGRKSEHYKPKRVTKPVVPITKEMEEGKEPMRTFGDLKQLFDKRKRPEK